VVPNVLDVTYFFCLRNCLSSAINKSNERYSNISCFTGRYRHTAGIVGTITFSIIKTHSHTFGEHRKITRRTTKQNHMQSMKLCLPAGGEWGGIATNDDGTLFASTDVNMHRVHIWSVADKTSCTTTVPLTDPRFMCFARRGDVDTLLICDGGNDRIVEVSVDGQPIRCIAVDRKGSFPFGVAYCSQRDVIAVSLTRVHMVWLLQYTSTDVIGSIGREYGGELRSPRGLCFTADGMHIVVADWGNNRVSKYCADEEVLVSHIATLEANGIGLPTDVL
jgi:hypothetical protein